MVDVSTAVLLKLLQESVAHGLATEGLADTPHNRFVVLSGMHKSVAVNGPVQPIDRLIIPIIEEEIVKLQAEENETCPRCGGDHSWCQSVQPGEYGPV